MFKPASASVDAVRQPAPPDNTEAANNVFKVLHGFYGNLFLSKFSTGEIDERGDDGGVASARRIWAYGLREFDLATIKSALQQCMDRYPEFPPSFPQFHALCAANKPREFRPAQPAIGMGQPLRSRYARQAREINERHKARSLAAREGFVAITPNLNGLKLAIANAVATAGGDEARELRRLDTMFQRDAT